MRAYTTSQPLYRGLNGLTDFFEDAFDDIASVATLGASRNKHVRESVKKTGEKWNVGNNTKDTMKSAINTVGVVSTLATAGAAGAAFAGAGTVGQGALAAGKLVAGKVVKGKVVGAVADKAAKPFVKRLQTSAEKKQRAILANSATGKKILTDRDARAAGLVTKKGVDKKTGKKVTLAIDPKTGKKVGVRRDDAKRGGSIIPLGLIAAAVFV
jgi:sporulation protein YlmC with PRC-barrel domain